MAKTDSELWAEILLGSQAAWGELIARYKSLVYSVSTYIGLSMADSADCFQQTWVLLYQNRRQIQDSSRLSSWLVTTAKREALRLRQRSGMVVGDSSTREDRDASRLPDEELERLEGQAHLESALKDIDLPCRELLGLFFFSDEDRTYEQIAQQLGYAPNTLGAKRRRCLEKLKRILIAQGYFEERKSD